MYAEIIEVDGIQEVRIVAESNENTLPLEYDLPEYNGLTHMAGVSGYEIKEDRVIVKYKMERKPRRRIKPADIAEDVGITAETLALVMEDMDLIAETVAAILNEEV